MILQLEVKTKHDNVTQCGHTVNTWHDACECVCVCVCARALPVCVCMLCLCVCDIKRERKG